MADFVSNDTGSTLLVTCVDKSDAVINLTGATIKLRWKSNAGAVVEKSMNIVSAAAGTCSYKFVASELYSPAMAFEIEITDSGGFTLSNTELITVTVRSQFA